MPFHCTDCDKPITSEFGFKAVCANCKKKERTKERKMDIYSIYSIYSIYNIYIYNIKYMLKKVMSRILWQGH